jgi:hypothetical protein
VLACKINEIRFLPSLVLVPMVSQHRVANYSHCPLTTRCCPCALQVLLLPLPPAWCEIHPARRRRSSWLLDVATQILMRLRRVVYWSRGGVGFLTRFGGGFATGIGGQLGLLDLYHQLLVLSFPLGWEAFTCRWPRVWYFLDGLVKRCLWGCCASPCFSFGGDWCGEEEEIRGTKRN